MWDDEFFSFVNLKIFRFQIILSSGRLVNQWIRIFWFWIRELPNFHVSKIRLGEYSNLVAKQINPNHCWKSVNQFFCLSFLFAYLFSKKSGKLSFFWAMTKTPESLASSFLGATIWRKKFLRIFSSFKQVYLSKSLLELFSGQE